MVRRLRALLIPLIGWALSISMARSLGVVLDAWGVLACVAGVHAAYQFDDLVDEVGFRRVLGQPGDPRLRMIAVDAALLACAAVASTRLVVPLLVLSLAGISYVPLKRFVPKNLLTAGAWTGTVFALPLVGLVPGWQTVVAMIALFATVVSNANLCDLPDIAADRENRVKGFTTLLGARAAARVAGTVGLAAAVLAFAAGVFALCLPGVCYAILGWGFPELLRQNPSAKVWVDAVLVTAGPVSLLVQT